MKGMDAMNGILLINKPYGMTSHDVVSKLRRILKTKKIGHSGTLDPQATGVLLVMVGKATKILPFLEDVDKEYIAEMKLGITTLSDDIFYPVLETKEVSPIDDFEGLLESFKGKQQQLPPMISSIKVNGKKLYEYALRQESVERPLRDIEIFDIEAMDALQPDTYRFKVHCSSGTYVRSICRDIALKSNNLGVMTALVRSKVGRFSIDECVTLEDVEAGHYTLHTINEVLSHYPRIAFQPIKDIYHGKHVRLNIEEDHCAMVDEDEIIAIYKRHHGNVFACVRGLW